jgi:hypothetical protein
MLPVASGLPAGSSAAFDVRSLPGVTAPFGFFDPLGVTKDLTVGRVNFLREVEIKHGRVAMVRRRPPKACISYPVSSAHPVGRPMPLVPQLASVGFLTAEQWHPLFGGHVDGPSYIAFQETADLLFAAEGIWTPLKLFWPAVFLFIAGPEIASIPSYEVRTAHISLRPSAL